MERPHGHHNGYGHYNNHGHCSDYSDDSEISSTDDESTTDSTRGDSHYGSNTPRSKTSVASDTISESSSDSYEHYKRRRSFDFWNFDVPSSHLDLSALKTIKTIIKTQYGDVSLVENRFDGSKFILKRLNKIKLLKKNGGSDNMHQQAKKEVEIHYQMSHPNIVKLYDYFHTKTDAYMLLEYCEEGDLFDKRKKAGGIFSDSKAAFYVYNIAKALKYCHSNSVVHRDIKLENVLLKKGRPKLTDFGWCDIIRDKNDYKNLSCGTVDYLPPEMINHKKYQFEVDIWSLGVLAYELLVGDVPFNSAKTYEELYNLIKTYSYNIPNNLSEDAADFIENCLQPSKYRMTIEEVLEHPWLVEH